MVPPNTNFLPHPRPSSPTLKTSGKAHEYGGASMMEDANNNNNDNDTKLNENVTDGRPPRDVSTMRHCPSSVCLLFSFFMYVFVLYDN